MRTDYVSPKGTENTPIERAMTIFVDWAKATDCNYASSIVRENLANSIAGGASPERAVQALLARVR